ncbi:MAG: hypothetical protein L3K06_06955, partial [Thermoplasmata archaeon]|nr:hypothetical protein [Thermoplasmata archaeon]
HCKPRCLQVYMSDKARKRGLSVVTQIRVLEAPEEIAPDVVAPAGTAILILQAVAGPFRAPKFGDNDR